MRALLERFVVFIMLGLIGVGMVQAQDNACSTIVDEAISAVEEVCADLGRNQACYGNTNLDAVLTSDIVFESPGDIIALETIQRLTLNGMDTESKVWGIALLAIQANIPDTLPGQNVTFIMFGDVSIESAETPDADSEDADFIPPMQAFYFNSGIGDSKCLEAPQSGLLVQTPKGVGEVLFTANEVDIALGSTAFFQAEPGDAMIVSVIEGQATLTAFGVTVTVPAGTQSYIELDEDGIAVAAPEDPQAYDLDALNALPLVLLPQDITIAEPLDLTAENAEGNTEDTDDGSEITTDVDSENDNIAPSDNEESSSSGALQVSADGGGALSECSGAGEPLYTFYINNQSNREVSLHWIDYNCEAVQYKSILPGESAEQGTYPTHPWTLVDSETGETIFGPWGADSSFTITVTNG